MQFVEIEHKKLKRRTTVPRSRVPHLSEGWEVVTDDQIPEKANERVAWIGDDVDRAVAALGDEQSRETPRKSVLDHIETVTTSAQDVTPGA